MERERHPYVCEAIASGRLEGFVFNTDEIEVLERIARGELDVEAAIRRARKAATSASMSLMPFVFIS